MTSGLPTILVHSSSTHGRRAAGVTVLGVVIGVVAVSLIAAWAIPWSVYRQSRESEAKTKQQLAAVREAIERFKHGSPDGSRLPSLVEMQIPGVVMDQRVGPNPLSGIADIADAAYDQFQPATEFDAGWCYDEATGRFWSASSRGGSNHW